MAQAKLDLLFFRRLWKLFGILFEKYNSRPALIFYVLTILSLIFQFVIYAAGLVPSLFFEVLGSKDANAFPQLAVYSIIIIVLNAVMKSCITYVGRILYLTWRQNICSKLHKEYFYKMNFYKLNVLDNTLDNIDQRITRDADYFTKEWSLIISRLVVVPFTLVYYSYQCFVSTTWLGPVIIYVYFIFGTIINRSIMTPIISINVDQEVKEGDFRYQHLKVRVNSESMAFYHAGETEHIKSNEKLRLLLRTQTSLFNWSFWLNSAVNIFDYVGGILSYLIIAIPIFAGMYDNLAPEELSALISRNSFVCIYLIHSFSQLIDMSGTVSDVAAHTHRLAQLFEATTEYKMLDKDSGPDNDYLNHSFEYDGTMLNANNNKTETQKERRSSSKTTENWYSCEDDNFPFFHLKNVSYTTPDGTNSLVNALTLTIQSGKNILITGSTGCGKTSLLRVLAGLFPVTDGTVKVSTDFGPKGVMYLPQKPLVSDGTLQDQIVYPRTCPYPEYSSTENMKRMMKVMEEVGLRDLVDSAGGLNGRSEVNWSDKLSTGEMQRLSFARLFYHHPNLAVLDEPTSGLSKATEEAMFQSCHKRDITCVTVAHSQSLQRHHDLELHLVGDGTWTMKSLCD